MSYDRVMPSCVELRYNLGEVRGVKNEHRGPKLGKHAKALKDQVKSSKLKL